MKTQYRRKIRRRGIPLLLILRPSMDRRRRKEREGGGKREREGQRERGREREKERESLSFCLSVTGKKS